MGAAVWVQFAEEERSRVALQVIQQSQGSMSSAEASFRLSGAFHCGAGCSQERIGGEQQGSAAQVMQRQHQQQVRSAGVLRVTRQL